MLKKTRNFCTGTALLSLVLGQPQSIKAQTCLQWQAGGFETSITLSMKQLYFCVGVSVWVCVFPCGKECESMTHLRWWSEIAEKEKPRLKVNLRWVQFIRFLNWCVADMAASTRSLERWTHNCSIDWYLLFSLNTKLFPFLTSPLPFIKQENTGRLRQLSVASAWQVYSSDRDNLKYVAAPAFSSSLMMLHEEGSLYLQSNKTKLIFFFILSGNLTKINTIPSWRNACRPLPFMEITYWWLKSSCFCQPWN